MKNRFAFLLLAAFSIFSGYAEDASTVLSAEDTDAITAALDTEVTVEGKLHNVFWVNDNVLMLTFREQKEGFIAVSFAKYREKLDEAFKGDIVFALKGKTVRITGEVTTYNERPQIVVRSASQIKVLP